MKTIAVIQSNYIPWKGYFDIINDADLFVFYDDVQYTKNDWRNRNKIKTIQGLHWLTIPVGSPDNRLICEVELYDDSWKKKHWETIKQSYSKAPYFNKFRDFLGNVYIDSTWNNLSQLNQYLIQTISREYLGITTLFKDSRDFDPKGHKLDRLIDLLVKAGAERYVSGPTAKGYIDEEAFTSAGIDLIYKDYSGFPEYPQLFPPFEHYVSILDVLLNCGPDSSYYIWGWRQDAQLADQELSKVMYESEKNL